MLGCRNVLFITGLRLRKVSTHEAIHPPTPADPSAHTQQPNYPLTQNESAKKLLKKGKTDGSNALFWHPVASTLPNVLFVTGLKLRKVSIRKGVLLPTPAHPPAHAPNNLPTHSPPKKGKKDKKKTRNGETEGLNALV